MNEYVCIGRIVNTHGIKGELRIKSDFELKNQVFKINNEIFIGKEHEPHVIASYRIHKDYDMITLKNLNNINDVLKYKNMLVYVKRNILEIKDYILSDLIGLEVVEDNTSYGIVKDYYDNNNHPILEVQGKNSFYIPTEGNYIKKVDLINKKLYTKDVRSLILWKLIF